MTIIIIRPGIIPPIVITEITYEGTCYKCQGQFKTGNTKDMFLRTFRGEDHWAIHCPTFNCGAVILMETIRKSA